MRSKVILAGVLAAAALALSACGPDNSTTASAGGTASATNPASGGGSANGHDNCLIGTWKVDVPDMARQAAAKMTTANATGTGSGDITVAFADQMTITYNNVVGISAPLSRGLSM